MTVPQIPIDSGPLSVDSLFPNPYVKDFKPYHAENLTSELKRLIGWVHPLVGVWGRILCLGTKTLKKNFN